MGRRTRLSGCPNIRSPAREKVPIISTRMTQTMSATKTGTAVWMVLLAITAEPKLLWLTMATETPHQVSVAFMAAARIQAPNRYQTSAGSSFISCSGVNRRAIPAKSIPQKAMDRIVAQRIPAKASSPSTSLSANSVVLKLKISKANRAPMIMNPKALLRWLMMLLHILPMLKLMGLERIELFTSYLLDLW